LASNPNRRCCNLFLWRHSKQTAEYWGGGEPWISGKDLKSHYLSRSIDTLTEKGFATAKKAPQGASLILVRGMTLLKDFPVGYASREVAFNQDIKALVPKKNVDGLFLSFLLVAQKNRIRQLVSTAGHGTGRLDTSLVQGYPINLPPLPEQKKIAQILSTWDQAITATERLLENSQQRKKGLMQQLLTGKKRLPGFEGEWEETRLGDLFAERSEIGVENLPLLSITSEDGVVYQDATGRKDTSNADKSKYKRICPGDIGYNTMRMWQGRSSLSDKDGVVSPAYTILASREDADSLFFSYLFKLPEMIHVFYRHSQGLVSDTWNLKYNHFRKIVWRVPPKAEQSAIAKILLASDFEIDALKLRIDYLKQEKKALMQQLLTGKRRVQLDTEAA
jgi:type I restriction enzyme, S subunit